MPYIGKKPENIIATAIDTTTGDFSGVVTANAGIKVDNITIDGSEIDLSGTGDFNVDVGGDIIIDSDGADILLKHDGTHWGSIFTNATPNNLYIQSMISDGDIYLSGNDGGSAINALQLDMSAAGAATFNGAVTANAGVVVDNITIDGTEIDLSSGDLTVDVAGDLILDVDGGDVHFQDAGQSNRFMSIKNSSGSAVFSNPFADGDITFQGNDNGVGVVTPLTLDMSTGGTATFAKNVTITDGNLVVASGHGIDFSATSDGSGSSITELLSDYEQGSWTPTVIASSGGTASLGTSQGAYTKIGRLVNVTGVCVLNGAGSTASSGTVQISSLPFTVSDNLSGTGVEASGNIGYYDNFATAVNSLNIIALDSDVLRIYANTDNTQTSATNLTFAMSSYSGGFRFTISYYSN